VTFYAHHITAVCQTPGDAEQTTVICVTDRSALEFLRDGDPGGIYAYVPSDEDPVRAQRHATAIADALNRLTSP
jgi:hypothetical protein